MGDARRNFIDSDGCHFSHSHRDVSRYLGDVTMTTIITVVVCSTKLFIACAYMVWKGWE